MTALWITLAILGYLFMAWVTATLLANRVGDEEIDGELALIILFLGPLMPFVALWALWPTGAIRIPRLWRRRD